MLFNSFSFLVFLIAFLVFYYLNPNKRYRFWVIVSFSVLFYGSWSPKYLFLLVGTAFIDFWAAQKIEATSDDKKKKLWLLLSIGSNLCVLGYFKYFNFFMDSANQVIRLFGTSYDLPFIKVILPLGISFYTFQSMAYTIDIYRMKVDPIRNFREFFSCVCFFPHLVAGPIVRLPDLHPQIVNAPTATESNLLLAFRLIVWGLFKKIVIADNTGEIANQFFNPDATGTGTSGAIIGALAFTVQIYADFSGYTDMGRGFAKLIGINLCLNFYKPYFSESIQEFWRRWHISLSSWLREYLYISLGGNRHSEARTYLNLFLTMLIGGLWHGASFTFILWGAYHGGLLAIERYFRNLRGDPLHFKPLKVLITFILVVYGWVLFRANDMKVLGYWNREFMSGDFHHSHFEFFYKICIFGSLLPLSWMLYDRIYEERESEKKSWLIQDAVMIGMVTVLCFMFSQDIKREFIYFQF